MIVPPRCSQLSHSGARFRGALYIIGMDVFSELRDGRYRVRRIEPQYFVPSFVAIKYVVIDIVIPDAGTRGRRCKLQPFAFVPQFRIHDTPTPRHIRLPLEQPKTKL